MGCSFWIFCHSCNLLVCQYCCSMASGSSIDFCEKYRYILCNFSVIFCLSSTYVLPETCLSFVCLLPIFCLSSATFVTNLCNLLPLSIQDCQYTRLNPRHLQFAAKVRLKMFWTMRSTSNLRNLS